MTCNIKFSLCLLKCVVLCTYMIIFSLLQTIPACAWICKLHFNVPTCYIRHAYLFSIAHANRNFRLKRNTCVMFITISPLFSGIKLVKQTKFTKLNSVWATCKQIWLNNVDWAEMTIFSKIPKIQSQACQGNFYLLLAQDEECASTYYVSSTTSSKKPWFTNAQKYNTHI